MRDCPTNIDLSGFSFAEIKTEMFHYNFAACVTEQINISTFNKDTRTQTQTHKHTLTLQCTHTATQTHTPF